MKKELILIANESALTGVYFSLKPKEQGPAKIIDWAKRELEEYFLGKRQEFMVPVELHGTEFQQKVWAALQAIPYGQTRSYGQIAAQIGLPKAVRAVGLANSKNPVSIMVPCHRVIGSKGQLTGYAAGLENKKFLLGLEHASLG